MVHNGIEYGLMASYAEGLDILRHAEDGGAEYRIDVAEVAEVWRRGSVISSWLLDLAAAALHDSPRLEGFAGRVSDSGEGRWAAVAAIDEGVPAPVLSAALFARFDSRGEGEFANRVLSAMRREFGGHAER
jgi:6-phosphogluconate dehydrogenase